MTELILDLHNFNRDIDMRDFVTLGLSYGVLKYHEISKNVYRLEFGQRKKIHSYNDKQNIIIPNRLKVNSSGISLYVPVKIEFDWNLLHNIFMKINPIIGNFMLNIKFFDVLVKKIYAYESSANVDLKKHWDYIDMITNQENIDQINILMFVDIMKRFYMAENYRPFLIKEDTYKRFKELKCPKIDLENIMNREIINSSNFLFSSIKNNCAYNTRYKKLLMDQIQAFSNLILVTPNFNIYRTKKEFKVLAIIESLSKGSEI